MKVVIYGRVSTILQDYQHQVFQLQELAKRNGWTVLETFTETISGARKNEERPVLMQMLRFIQENQVDKVLTFELSRIGRNPLEVLKTLDLLHSLKVSCYIHQFSIETLDMEGKPNIMAQFMATMLSAVGSLERTQIRARMQSGYQSFRADGGKVGRKTGYKKSDEKYLQQYPGIVKLLNSSKGYSLRKIAKLEDVSLGTVQKVKSILSVPEPQAA